MLRRTLFALCLLLLPVLAAPCLAQPAPEGLQGAWEGNWDENPASWSVLVVKADGENRFRVIYYFAGAGRYETRAASTDGKTISFAWGASTFQFSLTANGKVLQGTHRSGQTTNRIIMTRML